MIESGENWCHRCVGVAEEDAAADANENPAEAFEDGLAFEVVLELFRRVPFLTVALNSKALRESFDNKIDPASTDGPLRLHAVACAYESLQNQLLENGVGSFALFFHRTQKCLRVACVLNESPPQVAAFEVCVWVDGMHDPQLVTRTADGDVVALLVEVFRASIAVGELSVVGRAIHH